MMSQYIYYILTRLGKSGLKISKIILGCMSYGAKSFEPWIMEDEDKIMEIMKAAYDAGIRTFDTADVYSNGVSEKWVGKFIKKYNIPRQKLVILSKLFFYVGEEGESAKYYNLSAPLYAENERGLSRKHIFDAIEKSVERLGTYIDVYQIHRFDTATPKEEVMEALHDVVKSGKVRYIGASSMKAYQFVQLQSIAEAHGWTKFISMQNFYNLIYREEEREMIPYCDETGVGLIPWSPLARGLLARPYDAASTLRKDTDAFKIHFPESSIEINKRVEKVAKDKAISMAAVATAWVLSKGAAPIIGLSSVERINDAILALSVKLTDEEISYLEEPYVAQNVIGNF